MENNKQMSMFGVGPKLALATLTYTAVTVILEINYPGTFRINFLSRNILMAAGLILLIAGLVLHIVSAKTILEVHKKDILFTGSVFKICRHPMYAAWIFFNLPGIALLFNSWLLLTVPLFMFIMFRVLISTEENYLKERFPSDYPAYSDKVNLVFPCLWRLFSSV